LEKYATFINGADLNAEQEQYLKNILDYISVNGDMELERLHGVSAKALPLA